MEEDTELPLTQCPDKSRRVWEPEWLMVLVNTFEPYQETFSRQKRDENGEARIFKEASELWAAFEEDFLTKMPMVRRYFTAKQPVKSKMLGLKEELKKTVEACGASGSGGNEKLAQPLFKRLMQMYQQDPLIVPKEFLDSHSTFCHHLRQCCSFGRVTAYKFAGMQLIFTCAAYVADAAREAVREVAGTRTAETGLQPIAPINPVGCKRNAQQALPHSYLLTSQRGGKAAATPFAGHQHMHASKKGVVVPVVHSRSSEAALSRELPARYCQCAATSESPSQHLLPPQNQTRPDRS